MNEIRFLIQVVELYYRDGLSQERIAKMLNTSRTSISRTLIKARNEGFVSIKINYPESGRFILEQSLEEKYGMKEIIVAVAAPGQSSEEAIALCMADYLYRVLKEDLNFGITWGRSMFHFVEALKKDERFKGQVFEKTSVVPFLGTSNLIDKRDEYRLSYSNFLTAEIGNILGSISYNLPAPMIVKSEAEKLAIESIGEVRAVLDMAKKVDLAFLGIGAIVKDSSVIKAGAMSESEYEILQQKGAVGEIVAKVFDENGQDIDDDLNKRSIGISLKEMKEIPLRVGIAHGEEKLIAIKAALRAGLVNVLICDDKTAKQL